MNLSKLQREAVRLMYGGRCAYCGAELGKRWHADHVEPVIRYPSTGHAGAPILQMRPERNRLDNLKPACMACNINKHSMPLETWRRHLEGLNDALIQYASNFRHALRFGLVAETRKPIVFHFETYNSETTP